MFAIICQLDYPRCKTKNRWRSVDAHFQNRAGSVSLPLLHIKATYTSFMNVWIQLPVRLPKEQDQKSLTRRWLSFSGWGRERFSLVFNYKGGQYIRKGQQSTNVNILRLAIGYLNATINRIIRIPEPEIGTDGSSQTRQNPRVDGYGSGFGPPRCSGSGFWTGLEPNQIVLAVRTRTAGWLPGPVANTTWASSRLGSCSARDTVCLSCGNRFGQGSPCCVFRKTTAPTVLLCWMFLLWIHSSCTLLYMLKLSYSNINGWFRTRILVFANLPCAAISRL
jgi:hypothetical protein